MNTSEKIRSIREQKHFSQEQMAEKLNMSQSGYAKIERGETRLHLDKLEQIAQILDTDISNLMNEKEKNISLAMNGTDFAQTGLNIYHNNNYYGNDVLALEISQLKLSLQHQSEIIEQKDLIIQQKDNELNTLREMITLLKKQK